MSYKIKVKPEDFIVKEISSIELKKKGQHAVFILKKRGWNTVDLLKKLAQKLKITFDSISYGGKKDRHAVTEQIITIKNFPKDISFNEDNFSLKFVGFSDVPMEPKLIQSNLFKITIRAISEKACKMVVSQIENLKDYGFINYFDDQRFGSFDPKQGFIAEKILKEHYNGALKIYLTHIYPEDKRQTKERKKFFLQHWTDWQACLTKAKTVFEKRAFQHLIENPKDYLTLLRKIPYEEMSMFFSAYQSFLWNETVRRLIKSLLPNENLLIHRGIAGDYIFHYHYISNGKTDESILRYLKSLTIPTASSKTKMPDINTEKIYKQILDEHGIKPSIFNLRKIRQAFFKSVDRAVIVMPESLLYRVEDDEIYEGKKKIVLEFVLPRGSYATMLIKRIFAKNLGVTDRCPIL